jgi:hypothetical protein
MTQLEHNHNRPTLEAELNALNVEIVSLEDKYFKQHPDLSNRFRKTAYVSVDKCHEVQQFIETFRCVNWWEKL